MRKLLLWTGNHFDVTCTVFVLQAKLCILLTKGHTDTNTSERENIDCERASRPRASLSLKQGLGAIHFNMALKAAG